MAKTVNTGPKIHHFIRTPLASLFGFLAALLISASLLVVWANTTLTSTSAYTQAVDPVLKQPELQQFVATQITTQLESSVPITQIAQSLLSPNAIAGQNAGQLQNLVSPVIQSSITQILASPAMQTAWANTNASAHTAFMQQLNANDPVISIDLSPIVRAVLNQLGQTKLAPVAGQINLNPSSAVIQIKGAPLEQIHRAYRILTLVTWAVILASLLFIGLAVWISVHHLKTLRRVLTGTTISALLTAAVLALSTRVQLPNKVPSNVRLAETIAASLLHGLQVDCLVLAAGCIVVVVGTKLLEKKLAPK